MCPNVFDNREYSFFVNNVSLNPESMKCSSVLPNSALSSCVDHCVAVNCFGEKRTFAHGLSPRKGKGQLRLTFSFVGHSASFFFGCECTRTGPAASVGSA